MILATSKPPCSAGRAPGCRAWQRRRAAPRGAGHKPAADPMGRDPLCPANSCIYIQYLEGVPMTASTLPARRLPGAAALAATVWLILAIAAGATGFFLRLPFPGPQLIILGLVVLTLVAGLVPSRLRAWIDAIPLRVLVGVNATRYVGIAFLDRKSTRLNSSHGYISYA